MSTTTAAVSAERTVALELIDCPANVRELDLAHVDALAGSIALRGLIVPLVVRAAGDGRFTLVAGFHRHAACQRSGVDHVPVVVREEDGESADRAAENVVRKALTPLEEARAVKAMLDQGYTLDGAASVLGWARQRVSARAKLLELPDRAQQLVGAGTVPVSGVDAFIAIAAVSRPLCELVADAIAEAEQQGSELGGSFASNPGWVVQQTLSWQQRGRGRVWAAYLTSTSASRLEELKLGKKAEQLLAEAEQLERKLSPYGYGPPAIEFAESDVDQARAAGVLLELDHRPLILDRALYRELAKGAIARTVDELRARDAAQAELKAADKRRNGSRERTPLDELEAEHRAQAREFADRARSVNLDLGRALLTELATVDPTDISVARFFALCGGPHRANYADGAAMPTRSTGCPVEQGTAARGRRGGRGSPRRRRPDCWHSFRDCLAGLRAWAPGRKRDLAVAR